MWADVPASHQVFRSNASATSAFAGATVSELDDIKNGAVVERVEVFSDENQNLTLAQIRSILEQRWQAFQNEISQTNTWDRYGSFLSGDGTSWTNSGV